MATVQKFKLISREHLIIISRLDDPECVLILPLNPRLAFFAAHSFERVKHVGMIPASRLARLLNHETIRFADKQIYAANAKQAKFICRHFKPTANS